MLFENARAACKLWLCAIVFIAAAQPVTTADLENAAGNNSAWLSYGRDYHAHLPLSSTRLRQKTCSGCGRFGLLPQAVRNGGLEATPLLHNGVLYISADGARVFAINARTGAKIWSYDPATPDEAERVYCWVDRSTAASPCSATCPLLGHSTPASSRSTKTPAKSGRRGRRLAPGLHHHRRAARREGHGADWHGRRRVWHARIRQGV
ncbi:MAG: hypothetical protein R2724_28090 [Bryobacterales bacterium]